MEKVIQHTKRIWNLAITNKKVTIGVIIVLIILYTLATK
jgi:hypothetical protein